MNIFRRLLFPKHDYTYYYDKIEYIENQSNAYIDTGITPNQDTRLKIRFAITQDYTVGNLTYSLYGVEIPRFTVYVISSKYRRVDYGQSTQQYGTSPFVTSMIYNIDQNKNKYTCQSEQDSSDYTYFKFGYSQFTCPNTLLLFSENRDNRQSYPIKARTYSCQIYDNDVLVRDFVPVKRKVDNMIGLYDTVNNRFYTSPNKTKFIGSQHTFTRYSDDGGETFTPASQSAIDAIPLEGKNLWNMDSMSEEEGIDGTFAEVDKPTSSFTVNVALDSGEIGDFGIRGVLIGSQSLGVRTLTMSGYLTSSVDTTLTVWNTPITLTANVKKYITVTVENYNNYDYYIPFSHSTEGAFTVKFERMKIEVGDVATDYTPSPAYITMGTTEGKWMGTAVWDKPYPPASVSAYTWTKLDTTTGGSN